MPSANKKEGTGITREKETHEVVWPTRKSPETIILSFLEFAKHNRNDAHLTMLLGLGVETESWKRIAAAIKLAADCGTDLEKMAALYDKIQGTESCLDKDEVVSVPGPDHKGVGFYPVEPIWCRLEYRDGEAWKLGYLADQGKDDDGLVQVAVEEDPMADVVKVKPQDIRRPK